MVERNSIARAKWPAGKIAPRERGAAAARLMRTGSAIRQASQEGYLLRRSVGETRIRQKFWRSDWTVRGSTLGLTPSLLPGNGLFGFGHLPSDLPRETRPNSATLRLFYADFSTVSPRAVALLCTNRPAAPASLAQRRENSLRKRTI